MTAGRGRGVEGDVVEVEETTRVPVRCPLSQIIFSRQIITYMLYWSMKNVIIQ